MLNPLHSSTNQKLYLWNKVATMKNRDDFYCKRKPSCAATKSNLFTVNKDEWNTKEDTGKSIKNAFYVQHLSDQSNVE